jgi:hypothetical protein
MTCLGKFPRATGSRPDRTKSVSNRSVYRSMIGQSKREDVVLGEFLGEFEN